MIITQRAARLKMIGLAARCYCKRLELEIVGSDEVATYLSEFLICRGCVDSPGVDFETCVVVFFYYAAVDSTVVDVGVDVPLFAPTEIFA
jgi:hypothetical protein